MQSGLDRRLTVLEARRGAGWKAWQGKPLAHWPDDALHAYLGDALGMAAAAVAALSDDDLGRVIARGA